MSVFKFIKDNFITIAGTIAVAVATGGTSLAVQAACCGAALVVGNALDTDRKKRENESKQLELKKGISNEVKKEVENLQDDRSQKASQLDNIANQLAQKRNKLNDSNVSETEKEKIRKEIAFYESQTGNLQNEVKILDDKISELIKTNPINKPNSNSIINLPKVEELDFQTKLIIGGIIFLIIYFVLIKDSDRK